MCACRILSLLELNIEQAGMPGMMFILGAASASEDYVRGVGPRMAIRLLVSMKSDLWVFPTGFLTADDCRILNSTKMQNPNTFPQSQSRNLKITARHFQLLVAYIAGTLADAELFTCWFAPKSINTFIILHMIPNPSCSGWRK